MRCKTITTSSCNAITTIPPNVCTSSHRWSHLRRTLQICSRPCFHKSRQTSNYPKTTILHTPPSSLWQVAHHAARSPKSASCTSPIKPALVCWARIWCLYDMNHNQIVTSSEVDLPGGTWSRKFGFCVGRLLERNKLRVRQFKNLKLSIVGENWKKLSNTLVICQRSRLKTFMLHKIAKTS